MNTLTFLKRVCCTAMITVASSAWSMSSAPSDDSAREILAHRGASGMYPQSTWLAFDQALQQGADVLEMDVHLSKDDVVIVNHDEDFTKTTGSNELVKNLTLAEIKMMDAGYKFSPDGGATFPFRGMGLEVLTLEEVLTYFPNENINVEMKANSRLLAEKLWALIRDAGAESRSAVASQHTKAMNQFREVSNGKVKTSATIAELTAASIAWSTGFGWAYKPKFQLAQIPYAIVTKPYLDFFRKKGVKSHVWTVNDADKIERVFELGADGVIGDYPDRIYQALVERGERPPLN